MRAVQVSETVFSDLNRPRQVLKDGARAFAPAQWTGSGGSGVGGVGREESVGRHKRNPRSLLSSKQLKQDNLK